MLQDRYTTRRRTVLLGTAASIAALMAGEVAKIPFALAQTAEKPRFFSAEELAFVTAMVNRLIPSDEVGPGAVELGVPYFIDTQLMTEYGAGGIWYMTGPFVPSSAPEFGYQLPFTPQQRSKINSARLSKVSLLQIRMRRCLRCRQVSSTCLLFLPPHFSLRCSTTRSRAISRIRFMAATKTWVPGR